MRLKDLKIQYLEHLEIEKNRSPKTLENYNRYLERFLTFIKSDSLGSITEDSIRQYRLFLNRLQDKDGNTLKKVTQNYHIIALRNFLKYLSKRDIQCIPADKIELGKQEQREVTFLELDELDKILQFP